MAVAAVALVGGALFQTKRFTLGSAPGALLLLYTVFVAFSVPMSIWPRRSIEGVQEVAKLMVIFLVTVNVLTTRKRLTWFIAILLILIVVYPARGALEWYTQGIWKEPGRANWYGLFGNSNMLALTMLMHLPFVAVFLTLRRSASWRLGWAAVGVLLVTVAVLTKSRAGFLALGMFAMAAILLSRRRIAVSVAVVVATAALMLLAPQDFRERMGTIFAAEGERDYSATSRQIIWGVAIDVAMSRPLTGIGVSTFDMANAERAPEELGTSGGDRWRDTHSTYLNIWAEIGTPGVIAFLAALGLLLQRSWRAARTARPEDPLGKLLRAGVVSMLVFAVMGIFNTFHNAWFFYVIFAAMLAMIELVDVEAAAASVPAPAQARRHSAHFRRCARR
jgi:O-antigen ligase